MDDRKRETDAASMLPVNDYYPDFVRYHSNVLLSFFDNVNMNYHVDRKTRFRAVQTREDALSYAAQVRSSFAGCLGDLPYGGPVSGEVVRTLHRGRYFIDNVLIEALPGYFLSANFYYPSSGTQPRPAILFPCGHSENGKAYGLYVSFCVEAVLNGFCVLTFDPVGQGERKMYGKGDSEHFTGSPDAVHYVLGQQAWLAGTSLTAYMMRDNVAALDYLCSRKEADPGAVTVAGNSGGGQMAAFMGAYDPRVAAVVSSCYVTGLAALCRHIGAQECEQSLPGFMQRGLDLADLAIAAAPKPFFIGASLTDFFPIEGTRDAWIDIRRIYRLLGCEENLDMHIEAKPHGFWMETRERALRFLCAKFGVEYVQDKAIDYDGLPAEEELYCAGGDINGQNAVTLQQMLMHRAEAHLASPPAFKDTAGLAACAADMKNNLADVLNVDFGRVRADILAETHGPADGLHITGYSFLSEEGMKIRGTLYEKERGSKGPLLLHTGDLEAGGLLEGYLSEYSAVFCVEPRGTGSAAVEPGCFFFKPAHFENEEASYCCNAAMLGRSVAGMRAHDVLGAAKLLHDLYGGCVVTLGGSGENALIALFAAVLLGGKDVILNDLLYSFRSLTGNRMYLWGPSVFVYKLLDTCDVPGLLAVLANHAVIISGLLDHMKNRLDDSQTRAYRVALQQLFDEGGGRLSVR